MIHGDLGTVCGVTATVLLGVDVRGGAVYWVNERVAGGMNKRVLRVCMF